VRSLYSLAWRNLASRRLRTFLTGTAIALGVAAVFATSFIAQSAQARTASLAKQVSQADLQIAPRDSDMLDVRWLDVVRAANLPVIEAIRDEVSALHRKRPRQ